MCFDNNNNGSMAEGSNATDSRSVLFGGAGSNPAGTIIGYHTAITIEFRIKLDRSFASWVRIPPHLPRVCIQVVKGGFQHNGIRQQTTTVPLAQSVEHETFKCVITTPTM